VGPESVWAQGRREEFWPCQGSILKGKQVVSVQCNISTVVYVCKMYNFSCRLVSIERSISAVVNVCKLQNFTCRM